jgi:ribA/ribD-fused uncharacterized protein
MPTDRAALEAAVRAGERFEYLFFWGHTPKSPPAVDKSCLSQWYPAPFHVDGHRYATAEHWMMAGKARLFGDDEALADILAADSPADAKAIGRRVRSFDAARWRAHCVPLVTDGNAHKFGQHPALRKFLHATADHVLVEASPRDRVWGIGMGATNEAATDPTRWRGENLLGFALMMARARLRGD